MGQSSPATTTQINKTEPDPVTQKWRNELFTQAQGLYGQPPPAYFPGNTVVPFSSQTTAGLNMLQQQAAGGAPNYQAANDASARILSGYNPALAQAGNASQGGLFNQGLQGVQGAAQQGAMGLFGTAQQNAAALGGAAQQGAQRLYGAANQNIAGLQGAAGQNIAALNGAAGQNVTAQVQPQLQQTGQIANQLATGFGGASNPYLDSLYQSGARQVANDVNAQFSRAGRSGPNAAHAEGLAQGLGSLYANIYAPAYEAERGRQMQGLQSGGQLALANAGLTGDLLNTDAARGYQGAVDAANYRYGAAGDIANQRMGAAQGASGLLYGGAQDQAAQRYQGASDASGLRYQGASDAAGIYGQDANRQLAGTELLGSLYGQSNTDALRAQGLLPSLYEYGGMPGQQMLGVGSAYENLAQDYMDDARARYDYTTQAPYSYMQQYANILNGLPDFSGSTTTQSQRNSTNRLMGAMGGATTGASIGSMFGPVGGGIGAGIGGLFGLFG